MLVSAIIPTYNRAHLICRAIESVLVQSYNSIELIIIDDGSTDATEEAVNRYTDNSSITIKYFKKSNGGCASARNKGVELASGDFVAFLDSDDLWMPNALYLMVEALKKNPSADFVYSPVYEVYGDAHDVLSYPAAHGNPDLFRREHFLTSRARACSVMYKRVIFEDLRLNESLKYNEDSDFLQRVAIRYKAAYLDIPTARVFNHVGNKSANRVGIYTALLISSLGILDDFPEFAVSMGEDAVNRIHAIRTELVNQLLIYGDFDSAVSVSEEVRDKLSADVRLSLMIRSSSPIRSKIAAQKVMKRIKYYLEHRKTRKHSMNIMHIFGTYLPMTENWCYRLIKYLPDTQLYIVAEKSENGGVFVLPNSLCLVMPTVEWPMAPHSLIKTGTKLLCLILRKIWMRLVIHFAGRSSIIHAHFSYMGWNYLQLSKSSRVPMVVSFYGYDYENLPNRDPVWRDRYTEMFSKVSMFIAEGGIGRSKLIAMGCPEKKVEVVHLGVETSIIPFYRRIKPPGELRLVQVATFTSKKGHDVTVKAFILAASRCPGITLTLVGKDPEGIRSTLQRTIREAGLDGQVEFIDGIDFAKLHSFLKPFHLFIHPSRYGNKGDSEGGAPVVLLDAQATGMPVLATKHCDIPEEVIHGETGILVEEGDFDSLAAEIERFYWMNEAEYACYCENARRHIEKNYDSVDSGRRLREVYEGVVRVSCN
jgi:colanic acid/amylovoran biosynthesis glycosyltransferase